MQPVRRAPEGIDLISPTSGHCPEEHVDPETLTAADFEVEEGTRVGPWGRTEPDLTCLSTKQVRLINRRRREQTREFKEKYRTRSGIEATNSIIKRVTGMDRLRIRGRPAVFMSILLRSQAGISFEHPRCALSLLS